MNKILVSLLTVFAVMTSTTSVYAVRMPPPMDGNGTPEDPYKVSTLEHLKWISEHSYVWNEHFRQTADIDASDTSTWNDGKGFSPIGRRSRFAGPFTGTYDGAHHTIDNLYINRPDTPRVGLFGLVEQGDSEPIEDSTTPTGEISHLGVTNADITGKSDVGGLVGQYGQALETIKDCYTTGKVEATGNTSYVSVGGLVGYSASSTITDSHSTATVIGTGCAGGLVGYFSSGTLKNSYFSRTLEDTDHQGRLGGLIGRSHDVTIENCYSVGTVNTGSEKVGGLIGDARYSTVKNSYSRMDVMEEVPGSVSYAGGLIGKASSGSTISQSYSTGQLVASGANIGGLVGAVDAGREAVTISDCYSRSNVRGGEKVAGLVWENNGGTITNSYSTGDVYAVNDWSSEAGLVGDNKNGGTVENAFWDSWTSHYDSDAGTKQTTLHMKTLSTFTDAGWDFTDDGDGAWDMDQLGTVNAGYPILAWQNGADNMQIAFSQGQGTPENPYEITNLTELRALTLVETYWDDHYIQTADIDAAPTEFWDDRDDNSDGNPYNDANDTTDAGANEGFTPIGSNSRIPFVGTYDGQGHTIDNLSINRPEDRYIGLFGRVQKGNSTPTSDSSSPTAEVRNLGVTNVEVIGGSYVGALVGRYAHAPKTIENCYSTGTVQGAEGNSDVRGAVGTRAIARNGFCIGGLVGRVQDSTIKNSYSNATVKGQQHVGGLVGHALKVTIQDAYSAGPVVAEGNNQACRYIGGLIGHTSDSVLEDVYSTGPISINSTDTTHKYIGGLIGGVAREMTIRRAYSTSEIIEQEGVTVSYAGGLIGSVERGRSFRSPSTEDLPPQTISQSYSKGSIQVSGDSIGGLVGGVALNAETGTLAISNCYSRSDLQGNANIGGLIGEVVIDEGASTITNCYSRGNVQGNTNVGGLLGVDAESNTVENAFWDTDASGTTTSAAGTGKATAAMKTVATFTDTATSGLNAPWDFQGNPHDDTADEEIWGRADSVNNGYPHLKVFHPNTAPVFDKGDTAVLQVDEDAGSVDINTHLAATDAESGQTLTWLTTSEPSHGALSGFPAEKISDGASVVPSGLTYQPDTDYNGSDTFDVQVTDSLLRHTITVNVTVNAVNDAPTASSNTVTFGEDTTYAFQIADFNFSDVDDGDTLHKIQITSLSGPGTLALNGSEVAAGTEVPLADLSDGKLTFTPDEFVDEGKDYASFGFKVHDGSLYSTESYTQTIDLNLVDYQQQLNDVISDGEVTTDEEAELWQSLRELRIPNLDSDKISAYAAELAKAGEVQNKTAISAIVEAVNDGLKTCAVYVYNGWNLLSTPYRDCVPEEIFGDNLGGNLFRYEGDGYKIHNLSESMLPGYGYWVYLQGLDQSSGEQVVMAGPDVAENAKNLPIQDGWNLIGPFDVPADQRRVADMNYVNGHPFRWDAQNGGYVSVPDDAVLQQGQGYWGYIVDAEKVTDLALDGSNPFELDYEIRTVTIYLKGTAKGNFTHVKIALFDTDTQENVLSPTVVKKQEIGGGFAVTVAPSSLQPEHEYYIELAPIRDGVEGMAIRTSFYAAPDNDGDGIRSVPEFANRDMMNATASWQSDQCVITIPDAAGQDLQVKLDVKKNGMYENRSLTQKTVGSGNTVSVDLTGVASGTEVLVSVRFVDINNGTVTPQSGWKTFSRTLQ